MQFVPGQRWVSEMEPELGLGVVREVEARRVTLSFPAADCIRQYAIESARLHRVQFGPGDEIQTVGGQKVIVQDVQEFDGTIVYRADQLDVPERELCPTMSFKGPLEKLLAGLVDSNKSFDLRYQTLVFQNNLRKLPVHGFLGGRVDLIPHQLYIAHEVSKRAKPRVLLSDEVGLGKTIEACLVLHRMIITGRINRVLIAVPESLKHQWFVELLRKFNLFFRLMDEAYFESVDVDNVNPYIAEPLCLVSHEFLADYANAGDLACQAGWDMVVVDEAHHLKTDTPAYQLFADLSKHTEGLMLLTATPEQMGRDSHFSRLQLLDARRYYDYTAFQAESLTYHTIAKIVDTLIDNHSLDNTEMKQLKQYVPEADISTDEQKKQLIQSLIDRHGPGRVIFRNKRSVMPGFPKRQANLVSLNADDKILKPYQNEFESDKNGTLDCMYSFEKDPRILWLVDFLKKDKKSKVLVICKTKEKAKAIDEALRHHLNVSVALFHEAFSLIQRDKNAAWFAQPDGAQVLISSEIGSEGRNFQFAHHLVLFDVPLDPELLEQRIGRLDRIGQKHDVQIHVPFLKSSAQEKLVRWYHEGLDAFESYVTGAYDVYKQIYVDMMDCLSEKVSIDDVISKTRSLAKQVQEELDAGRDRLLEMASFQREEAANLVEQIKIIDGNRQMEQYATRLFDYFGIQIDPILPGTYHYRFDSLSNPAFPIPRLRDEGLTATFVREQAVHLEDVEFITWDHPMLDGAMELFLGMNMGNVALVQWPNAGSAGLLLDALFVLECVAPPVYHVDRFLPPTPVRVVLNHDLEEVTDSCSTKLMRKACRDADSTSLLENLQMKQLLTQMVSVAQTVAEEKRTQFIQEGLNGMELNLTFEIDRLTALKQVNPDVRQEEIDLLLNHRETLTQLIGKARLRLDALRVVILSD